MHRFHRHDNIVASEIDGARPGIAETVLPSELRSVSVDFARTGRIRRGAVAVGIGGIECNLERAANLMNAEFKHALTIQKFLVTNSPSNFAGPAALTFPVVANNILGEGAEWFFINRDLNKFQQRKRR